MYLGSRRAEIKQLLVSEKECQEDLQVFEKAQMKTLRVQSSRTVKNF